MTDRLTDEPIRLPDDLRALLARLREDTEQALYAADKAGIDGAINWADLACVSAGIALTEHDDVTLQVLIEEADPDSFELHQFVADYLRDRGYGDVEVLTQW